MLAFVEAIYRSKYSEGLYAWTSMHDLCISQQPIDNHLEVGPYLQISPLFNGMVKFTYIDTMKTSRQWTRTENEDNLFPRLEKFLDQLHWFVKTEERNDT